MVNKINQSSNRKSWRLVYTGNVASNLFETSGITKTSKNLFESSPTDDGANSVPSDTAKIQCITFAANGNISIAPYVLTYGYDLIKS